MEGTVKFYNFTKRFGFIAGEDGKDYFVHSSGLMLGQRLNEGDKVKFEVEQDAKGPKAIKVQKM